MFYSLMAIAVKKLLEEIMKMSHNKSVFHHIYIIRYEIQCFKKLQSAVAMVQKCPLEIVISQRRMDTLLCHLCTFDLIFLQIDEKTVVSSIQMR